MLLSRDVGPIEKWSLPLGRILSLIYSEAQSAISGHCCIDVHDLHLDLRDAHPTDDDVIPGFDPQWTFHYALCLQ